MIKPLNEVVSLVAQLGHADILQRRAAEEALIKIGPSSADLLLPILEGNNELSSSSAATVLGCFKDSRATRPLLNLLFSANRLTTKLAIVQALGDLGDPQAVEPLLSLLREGHPLVKIQIIVTLGKLQDQRAVDSLIDILMETNSPSIRYNAIRALAVLGDTRAIEPILAFAKDDDAHIRFNVRKALEVFGMNQSFDSIDA